MTHPDYTAQAIHLCTTHCRPFVAWNVCACLCVNFCLLPVNDTAAIHSMCVFICEGAVCVHLHLNHMPALWSGSSSTTSPSLCRNRALIFCFTSRKVSLHEREKWPSHLLTASHINELILCNLQTHPIWVCDKWLHHVVDLCLQNHNFKQWLSGVIPVFPQKHKHSVATS